MFWTCPKCAHEHDFNNEAEWYAERGGVHCPACRHHDPIDQPADHDCSDCSFPFVVRTHDEDGRGLAPGDVLVLSAAIRSFQEIETQRRIIGVDTHFPEIFANNPDVTPLEDVPEGAKIVRAEYPLINHSNQWGYHFMHGYVFALQKRVLSRHRKPHMRLFTNRPHLYLSDQEKQQRTIERPFWLLSTGTSQLTAKQWPVEHYQQLVDITRGEIQWVQTGQGRSPHVRGAIDLRNKTSLREFVVLGWHATGAVGPSTFLQHVMAAHQRPYVLLLGGREPVYWTAYPRQQTLHTIGELPCCTEDACWKSRTVFLGDGAEQDDSLCEMPLHGLEKPAPSCMAIIKPELVAEHVLRIARNTSANVGYCEPPKDSVKEQGVTW